MTADRAGKPKRGAEETTEAPGSLVPRDTPLVQETRVDDASVEAAAKASDDRAGPARDALSDVAQAPDFEAMKEVWATAAPQLVGQIQDVADALAAAATARANGGAENGHATVETMKTILATSFSDLTGFLGPLASRLGASSPEAEKRSSDEEIALAEPEATEGTQRTGEELEAPEAEEPVSTEGDAPAPTTAPAPSDEALEEEPEPTVDREAVGPAEGPPQTATGEAVAEAPAGPSDTASAPSEPAADADVGGELRAWKAEVTRATAAITQPDLAPTAQEANLQIQQRGAVVRDKHKPDRKRLLSAAQKAVKPAPETKDPPKIVEEKHPVPRAPRLVEAKSDRRLPDQAMPPFQRSPRGTMPQIGQPPGQSAPAPGSTAPDAQTEAGAPIAGKTPDQKKIDALREKVAEPVIGVQEQNQGPGIVLKDEPPKPSPPLPPVAKSAIASVLVQLLAQPGKEAERMLTEARTTAYGGKLQQYYRDIGSSELPSLTESLTTELRKVAKEAGIASETLEAKVKAHKDELAQQKQQVMAGVDNAGQGEREALQKVGEEAQGSISDARDAVDKKTEQQLEAARGEGDPTVVRTKRDRLKRAISRQAGQQRVAYEQARKRRHSQVEAAGVVHARAYAGVVRDDQQAILEPIEGTPPLRTNLEIAGIRTWGDARNRELQRTIIRMKGVADTAAEGFKQDIREAGSQARELIDEWANRMLGEQQSWWERLIARFMGWFEEAKVESEVWETVRAGETRDAILKDFVVLEAVKQKWGENVDLKAIESDKSLSAEQKAILKTYYGQESGSRNPIMAIAAGIRVRISHQRRPQLLKKFDEQLEGKPESEWENLDLLGKTQMSGFSAYRLHQELYAAMHGGVTGLGTDEERLFRALSGLTPVQSWAVRKCYKHTRGIDLDADIRSELSGAELDRAKAQLSGDQALADAATLHEAMHGGITGLGTDEDVIMRVLRGKSEVERQRIIETYKRKYGRDLSAELKGELSDHDLDQANALVEGDTAKADAIALDRAMHGGLFGWGTDETAIDRVYTNIRQEVVAEGARKKPKPWTTEQIEAEIARRKLNVEQSYGAKYGDDWEPGDDSALRQAFKSELSGPELNLANALADNNIIKADAARIAIEAQGILYADDDVVNGVLEKQYNRALEEIKRDEWPALQKQLDEEAKKNNWNAYQRRAQERTMLRQLEEKAKKRAKGYMTQLETSYDSSYPSWGRKGGLETVIENRLSGSDREKAKTLVEQGGYLSPVQRIDFAVSGPGTDEEDLKRALVGRSPEEIAQIRAEWERKHPGEPFDNRIASELSGRDEFDTRMLLKGEPRNAGEEIKLMREKHRWEMKNTSGLVVGVPGYFKRSERQILQDRMKALEEQYRILATVTGPERQLALERFKQRSGNVQTAIEGYREQADAIVDTVTSAAAIAAAVAAGFVTGGAAAVAIAALAAAATKVGTKRALIGGAYGWEDMAVDVAVGTVDVAVSYATAGFGAGLLKAARGGLLARMAANPSRASRIFAHALAEGAEGLVSSFPAAIVGNLLNDQNWEKGNPLANIALGTLIETGMGTVMGAGMGSRGGIRSPRADPTTPEIGDILALRGKPKAKDRLEAWRAYKAANPDASMKEFLRRFDEGVALRQAGEDAARQQQRRLREQLLSAIPSAQRGQFATTRIEVLDDVNFERFTRSKTGQAAVLIERGGPRVVIREGADPKVLREEGVHLLQSVDPDLRPKVRQLDERIQADWDTLDLDQQFALYRTKLELEIDAQQRLIGGIRGDVAQAGDVATRQLELDEARQTLDNLRRRLAEVDTIPPEGRLRIRTGQEPPPQYLDQPPRLFSKKQADSHPERPPRWDRDKASDSFFSSSQYRSYDEVRDHLPEGHRWEIDEASLHAWRANPRTFLIFRLKNTDESVPAKMLVRKKDGKFAIVERGSYPEAPTGFYYRHLAGETPEFQLRKIIGVDVEANYRIEIDTATGAPKLVGAKRKGWQERKIDLARTAPESVEAEYPGFEQRLADLTYNNGGSLSTPDQKVLRRWWQQALMVAELLDEVPGSKSQTIFLDDLFTKVQKKLDAARSTTEIPESAYAELRQELRAETAGLISRAIDRKVPVEGLLKRLQDNPHLSRLGLVDADPAQRPKTLLALFLSTQPDPSASKGHLFGAYRTERLKAAGGYQVSDAAPTLAVQRPATSEAGQQTVTRKPDGTVTITREVPDGPPKGAYLAEDKAGPGAFKLDQARDYATSLKGTSGDYNGLIYYFDSEDSAKKAFEALLSDKVSGPILGSPNGGIHVMYIDDNGRVIPFQRLGQ